ncbi:hypothetical protein BH20VER3_BH20VER3_12930 [soil metagenome]
MKKNLLVVAAAIMGLAACLTSLSAQTPPQALFGITLFGNELVLINPATGAATSIGSLGEPVTGSGLATRENKLYTYNPTKNAIQEISRVSGKVLRDIPLVGVTGLKGEGDLAIRPSDGVGFLFSPLNASAQPTNDFYTFSVGTGIASRLGTTGVALHALAFRSDGALFALAKGDSSLYTVNQTTGAAQAVGNLGLKPGSPIGALAFGPNDVLYASIDDRLYTINTATGAATVVSQTVLDFGFSSVSGLVFSLGAGTVRNMAARVAVGTNERVGIGGFIIRGTPAKTVVLRGVGPSITTVPGTLADPLIELFDSQRRLIALNDDHTSNSAADMAQIKSLGLTPQNLKESALIRTLDAGNYTVHIRGADGGTGVGLVEIYDASIGSGSSLANISSRGFVGTGNNILIGGLIVSGSAAQRVVVRAIGPDLATFNVPNPLQDPFLDIRDANGTSLGTNDNFGTGGQTAELAANGLTPGDSRNSALIRDFPPGNYTALVRGANPTGSTGVALVEFFNLTTDNQ